MESDGLELRLSTDDVRRLRRQIVRRPVEAPQWREVRGQAGRRYLEQMLGSREIAQSMQAEIPQLDTVREVAVDEGTGCFRCQDLAAVRSGHDAGRPVNVEANVITAGDAGLAGVQADPNAHVNRARPLFPGDRALDPHSGCDRVRRGREDSKERIPLGPKLHRGAAGKRLAADPVVSLEQVVVVTPQRLEEPRRALDVAEEERYRSDRQGGHLRQCRRRHREEASPAFAGLCRRARRASNHRGHPLASAPDLVIRPPE
jgi:hypothetical protein